jgi:hypothetical protein
MSGKKNLRKRSFVDMAVQGGLVVRVLLYWIVYLFNIVLMLIFWRIATSATRGFNPQLDEMWVDYGPVLMAAILVLPIVIVDLIHFSNRFVGPCLRLRRSMQKLARGEYVAPIKFRDNDFWPEFADEFNAVLARVQDQAAAEVEESAPQEEEPLAVA